MVARLSFERICDPPRKEVFAIDLFRLIESGTSSRDSGSQGVDNIVGYLAVALSTGQSTWKQNAGRTQGALRLVY
jgi:hypothetical protein